MPMKLVCFPVIAKLNCIYLVNKIESELEEVIMSTSVSWNINEKYYLEAIFILKHNLTQKATKVVYSILSYID